MSLLSFCTPCPNKATTNKAITTKKLSFEEIKIQKDKRHISNKSFLFFGDTISNKTFCFLCHFCPSVPLFPTKLPPTKPSQQKNFCHFCNFCPFVPPTPTYKKTSPTGGSGGRCYSMAVQLTSQAPCSPRRHGARCRCCLLRAVPHARPGG